MSENFKTISMPFLRRISKPIPFDIYIKRGGGKYTKLFPMGEAIDKTRLDEYEQSKGIDFLYILESDNAKYSEFIEKWIGKAFSNVKELSNKELNNVLNDIVDIAIIEIHANSNVDEKSLNYADKAVHGCIQMLNQSPNSMIKVAQLVSKHPYVMKHSMTTSIFALLLAKADGMKGERNLFNVGLGALIHDIGMSRISFDIEEREELEAEEWKEVKTHPELGVRLIDGIQGIPREVKLIIMQHHEQPNGSGYPNGIYGSEIYYPAKIVSIADSFSSLISKRPFRDPYTAREALQIMRDDVGKFDPDLVEKFAQALHLK